MEKSNHAALGISEESFESFVSAVTAAIIASLKEPSPAQIKAGAIQIMLEQHAPTLVEAALIGLMVEQAYNAAVQQSKKFR